MTSLCNRHHFLLFFLPSQKRYLFFLPGHIWDAANNRPSKAEYLQVNCGCHGAALKAFTGCCWISLRFLWNLVVHFPNMKAQFQQVLPPSSLSSFPHPHLWTLCSPQLCLPGSIVVPEQVCFPVHPVAAPAGLKCSCSWRTMKGQLIHPRRSS